MSANEQVQQVCLLSLWHKSVREVHAQSEVSCTVLQYIKITITAALWRTQHAVAFFTESTRTVHWRKRQNHSVI